MDKYQADILRMSADGKTTREIAFWLGTQGLQISHVSVAGWLKKKKAERAAITQETLQEELPKQLTADLDRLNSLYEEADETALAVKASWAMQSSGDGPLSHVLKGTVQDWIKLKELQLKTLALKLDHAGAGDPGKTKTGPPPVVVLPRNMSFAEWKKLWA